MKKKTKQTNKQTSKTETNIYKFYEPNSPFIVKWYGTTHIFKCSLMQSINKYIE